MEMFYFCVCGLNVILLKMKFLPLLDGMTSGFLSSFSNISSDSERNGSVTFSLTGRNPGLSARDPSRREARILSAPKITTVTNSKAATIPTNIPNNGAISNWSLVPNDSTKTITKRIISWSKWNGLSI